MVICPIEVDREHRSSNRGGSASTHVIKPLVHRQSLPTGPCPGSPGRGISVWGSRVRAGARAHERPVAHHASEPAFDGWTGQQVAPRGQRPVDPEHARGPAAANCGSAGRRRRLPPPRSPTTTRFRCRGPTPCRREGGGRGLLHGRRPRDSPDADLAPDRPRPPGLPHHRHELTGSPPGAACPGPARSGALGDRVERRSHPARSRPA